MLAGRTKRAFSNGLVSIAGKLILMVAPFFLRTVIIAKLGIEYLGLNSLFSSLLSMLSLTELGFGSAVIFSMYKPMAEGNDQEVCALLNFYKNIYRAVGGIITVVGLVFLPFLKSFVVSDYPENINIYIVYLIYLINTVVSYFLFAYKNSVFIASMRNDIDSIITTICHLAMYLAQIVVLLLVKNYYIYAVCLPLFTIINNIIKSYIVDKKYPQYRSKGRLTKEKKHDIITRVGALIGNKIGGVVFASVDSLVISAFLGLAVLGKYSNYYLIFTSVSSIMAITFSSIQAIIGNSMVCRNEDENYKTFNELFFINTWLTIFCSCCFACLYQPFIKIWVGEENQLNIIITFLLALYYFVRGIGQVGYTFKEAAGMWREDWLKPYISVIANLCLNIILVKVIGLSGVILSSVFALAFIELPWETRVLFKAYFKKSTRGYYARILKAVLVAVVSIMISFLICNLLPESIIGLILRGLVCTVIPNLLIVLVYFRTEEFKSAKSRISEILKRKKSKSV